MELQPYLGVFIAFVVAALFAYIVEIFPVGTAELKRVAQVIILILFILWCVRALV